MFAKGACSPSLLEGFEDEGTPVDLDVEQSGSLDPALDIETHSLSPPLGPQSLPLVLDDKSVCIVFALFTFLKLGNSFTLVSYRSVIISEEQKTNTRYNFYQNLLLIFTNT